VVVLQYTDWSPCSNTCGEGTQVRERFCNSTDGRCLPSSCAGPLKRTCSGASSCTGCKGNPCYMGTCSVSDDGTFSCSCVGGWIGTKCDRYDGCDGIMANANAVCVSSGIVDGAACAGVAFGATDGVGQCASFGEPPANDQLVLQCLKMGRDTAQCTTLAAWAAGPGAGAPAEVMECSNPDVLTGLPYGACCGYGALPMVTRELRSECCAWRIGLDAAGLPQCCRHVDACNVCGGNATSTDADGTPLLPPAYCVLARPGRGAPATFRPSISFHLPPCRVMWPA
jgi:hypothetical protein